MSKEDKRNARTEERINGADVVALYDELDRVREEHPEAAAEVNPSYNKKSLLERLLEFYLSVRERFHIETQVNRKTYLWLHLLGGFGIHHFYSRHWIKGLIYLAICWTGISYGLTLIDWLEAFPKKADDNGNISV